MQKLIKIETSVMRDIGLLIFYDFSLWQTFAEGDRRPHPELQEPTRRAREVPNIEG